MTAIQVGDLVRVSDYVVDGNFAGVGKVIRIRYPWITVRGVDQFNKHGNWGTFDFEADRVTFLGGVVKREQQSGTKATNPKDAVGSDKLPLHLWPETATVMGTLGLLDGMLKYGRSNWRSAGVRATIYIDAVRRHINAYAEGEDIDAIEDGGSGLPHLAHALACLAILVDAQAAGKLTDDRAYNGAGYRALVEELTPHVARLKAKHADKSPKHYTVADGA